MHLSYFFKNNIADNLRLSLSIDNEYLLFIIYNLYSLHVYNCDLPQLLESSDSHLQIYNI
jgi:hypothetical protein